MNQRSLLYFIFLVFFSSFLFAERYLTEEQALALAFPNADSIEKKKVIVTNSQKTQIEPKLRKATLSRFFTYYEAKQGGKILGYAVIDEVLGKHLPITFLVAVDLQKKVQRIEILVYREDYGWEIRQNKFRSQFYGYGSERNFQLNTNVNNISGATISCRNITDGVYNILIYLETLLPKEASTATLDYSSRKLSFFKRSQYLMGTLLEISLYAENEPLAQNAFEQVFQEVSRLEKVFSTYQHDSEISQINREAWKAPQRLSPDAFTLILTSKQLFERTQGAFDITINPLVQLWKDAQQKNQLPTADQITNTRQMIGMSQIHFDISARKIRFLQEGMSLDFGGIGKGYALDQATTVLKNKGIQHALLNFGGNICVTGPPPDASFWSVEIKDPKNPQKRISALRLSNGSVSTSANYERGLQIQGKLYSHLIDPRTGSPATGILSTTVIAENATEADALSTGLFILGVSATQKFMQQSNELGVLFVTESGEIFRFGKYSQFEK